MNDYLKNEYETFVGLNTDISQHLPKLLELGNECKTVTELGVRTGVSSRAFLYSSAKVTSYDVEKTAEAENLFNVAKIMGKDCEYIADPVLGNSLLSEIEPTDLLFIDTIHSYDQLIQELRRHHFKAKKYIVFHDTHIFGYGYHDFNTSFGQYFFEHEQNETQKGLLHAIIDFMIEQPEWKWKYHSVRCNGLTVLERVDKNQVTTVSTIGDKISVVVATMWKYPPFVELLSRLVEKESVGEIVLINNSFSNTPKVEILNHPKIKLINNEQNIFVNPSWNLGVSSSKYEKICIMNDDLDFNLNVFDVVNDSLKPHTLIVTSYNQNLNYLNKEIKDIQITPYNDLDRPLEFGHLFFLNKTDYSQIPDRLKFWCGDILQFDMFRKNNYEIMMLNNLYMYTPGETTSSTLTGEDRMQMYIEECKFYESYTSGNKKKILIAIPTSNDIEPATFKAIYDLKIPDGYEVEFQTFYGYRVDQVRNLIANWVEHSYDYLFAVDHDIVFPINTLEKLLSHNQDIVSGLYIQRMQDQHILEIWNENGPINIQDVNGKGLIPVHACGFGCVLVKKEVMQAIGYPQFEYHVALDHKNTFSEDHDFCKKAREKGFTVWADTSIKCDHIGKYIYTVKS